MIHIGQAFVHSCAKRLKLALSISILTLSIASTVSAQILPLVGNKVVTFIDEDESPSRASELVKAAFKDRTVSINATTQAWSGSGLRNGKYIGYIDHYSLNEPKSNYVYSQPYVTLPLHIASRSKKAESVVRLDKIYRQRLGIENRFANTDTLRGERSISWARAPDFFGNMQQLAGGRVEFIIADKYMLDEFNKLLVAGGEAPLYMSSKPIYKVSMALAIQSSATNANAIIADFNQGLEQLRASGELDNILTPGEDQASLLDASLFADIVKKW